MVSTAILASLTVRTPSESLFQAAALAAFPEPAPLSGREARRLLRRAELLASASNALASPRSAFCASYGRRCATRESSAGPAGGAALDVSSVNAAAPPKHSRM